MRTFAAIAMFLFGTTFLWLTASFAGRPSPPTGTVWTLVNVLALCAVAGFSVGAWGLYRDHSWWQTVAVASALVGMAAVVPFVLGLRQIDQGLTDLGVQINIWVHVLGSLAVIAVTQVPVASDWLTGRLT